MFVCMYIVRGSVFLCAYAYRFIKAIASNRGLMIEGLMHRCEHMVRMSFVFESIF